MNKTTNRTNRPKPTNKPTLAELRQRHPQLTYLGHQITTAPGSSELSFSYELHGFGELKTVHYYHGIEFQKAADELFDLLGMLEGLSYWKSCCPPLFASAVPLSQAGQRLFSACLLDGMGEFYCLNNIDQTWPGFVAVTAPSGETAVSARVLPAGSDSLLLDSCGKDSAVARLILGRFGVCRSLNVTTNSANSSRATYRLERRLDPALATLAASGYLNGHVPFSAVLAVAATAVAKAAGIPACYAANERSSDSFNRVHMGQPVNHQWSKSWQFEKLFADYLQASGQPLAYRSAIRPIYDLQSSAIAARNGFLENCVSCNRLKGEGWCLQCPKCLSSFITMAPFIGYNAAVAVCGGSPLTGPADNLLNLLGLGGQRPWECVATPFEIRYGLRHIAADPAAAALPILSLQPVAAALASDICSINLQELYGEHALPAGLARLLAGELAVVHHG